MKFRSFKLCELYLFFFLSNLDCQADSFYCSVIDLCTDRLKKKSWYIP